MNKTSIISIAIALLTCWGCGSTKRTVSTGSYTSQRDTLVIMSYNIENFFHADDDSLKNDDDFTPEGGYHWSMGRMYEKADRIKKVITSANGWNLPAIVGLCEIEGQKAVDYLISASGLKRLGYEGLCYPTPDKRGVAVAMLYDKERIKIIDSKPIVVSIPDTAFFTRDILYAKVEFDSDTFHIFVNHWPSKYGGEYETIWKREHVASCARNFCDSIRSVNPDANIVLMGDFNDAAEAAALTDYFGAQSSGTPYINLSGDTEKSSYKYRGEWSTIDHIIVSDVMCRKQRPIFSVCDLWFIRENDEQYGGYKPFRTYIGRTYHNGFSDHFPVMVKIIR
ncbi:MAG: endonuclease [Bacteroidales bacterium]|nr:endonuclease [Bacteroidales bacterium]